MKFRAGDPSLVGLARERRGHPDRSHHGRAAAVEEHRDLLEQSEAAQRAAVPVTAEREPRQGRRPLREQQRYVVNTMRDFYGR